MGKIDWDVEKALLAVMAVLILVGVGFIFLKRSEINELTEGMPRAEDQLAKIGRRYQEIDILERERENDELAKGSKPIDYLFRQMTDSGIGKRAFAIESPSSSDDQGDYIDSDWELRVKQGQKSFERQAIATLLLYIEANTNRMKVTRLKLQMDMSKGAQPDFWEPTITVTNRVPNSE